MKKILAMMAVLAVAALTGCEKKDKDIPGGGDEPGGAVLTAPVLTANNTSVVLSEASAASAALKLDWTAAASDVAVSYDVYINLASRDLFSTPVKHQAGSARSVTFTHGELNGFMTTLGATAATDIRFGVYASADDRESVLSNLVSVNITPYSEAFVNPAALYAIGTATPYAWDLQNSPAIVPSSEGVYTISSIPLRVLPLSNNQSIKFAFSKDGSDPRFAGQAPGEAFGNITVVETGQGYEFFPATAGYTNGVYEVTVNFNTMKMNLVRKGDLPPEALPDKLYILGDCVDWGWNFDGITLDKVSGMVYEANGINMHFGDGGVLGFKVFRGVNQWSPYFAMTSDSTNGNVKIQNVEDSDVPQFYPGKIGYTDGAYDISMDLSAMTATFTYKGDTPVSEPEIMYLHGGCFNPSWDFSDDLVLAKTSSGIYEGDITIVEANEWDGFKIWTDKNWTKWYGGSANSSHDNIIIVDGAAYIAETGAEDAQIYPVALGYNPGTYHFKLNMNTMRLTLTQ